MSGPGFANIWGGGAEASTTAQADEMLRQSGVPVKVTETRPVHIGAPEPDQHTWAHRQIAREQAGFGAGMDWQRRVTEEIQSGRAAKAGETGLSFLRATVESNALMSKLGISAVTGKITGYPPQQYSK